MNSHKENARENKGKTPLEKAIQAVEKVNDSGFVTIPSKPTKDMLTKVSRSTGLPIDIVNDVYTMMIKLGQE